MSDWKSRSRVVEAPQESGWKSRSKVVTEPVSHPDADLGPSASGAGMAGLQGFGQGASLGLSDEIHGAAAAPLAVGARAIAELLKTEPGRWALSHVPGFEAVGSSMFKDMQGPGVTMESPYKQGVEKAISDASVANSIAPDSGLAANPIDALKEGYVAARDADRSGNHAAEAAHPGAYGGGELAGALLAPVPGPGKAKPLQTVGSRALQFAKTGAILGGASAFGKSEGDAGGALTDAAKGAAGGAATGVVLGAVGDKAANKLREYLKAKAAEKAVQSITPSAGLANRLRNQLGISTPEAQQAFGKALLDKGIVKGFSGPEAALGRAEGVLENAGGRIGDTIEKADAAAAGGASMPFDVQEARIATRKALAKAADTPASKVAAAPILNKLLENLGEAPGAMPGTLGDGDPAQLLFRTAWKNKSQLQEALRPDEVSKLGDRMYRKGVAGYTANIYDQLERALGPNAIDELRDAAKTYGTAADASSLLRELVSRQAQGSKSAATALLHGVAEGGPLGAAAEGAGKFLRSPTGTATMASGLNAASNLPLNKVPVGLLQGTNSMVANGFQDLARRLGIMPKDQQEAADLHFVSSQ